MGILSCFLSCQLIEDSDSHLPSLLSLSSESSLLSVPSLNLPLQPSSSSYHLITTLHNHSAIFSLALANKHLITGSSDGDIRIWPHDSSNFCLDHHNLIASGHSSVKSVVLSSDKLFTAHQDHKIRVWKLENDKFKFQAVLPTIQDRVAAFFLAKNYVHIRRHVKCTWVHHVDTISVLTISNDKKFLYSASWDRSFKVWNVSNLKCIESNWNAHDDAINALVVSNDGFVYTGSGDRKIKVWEKEKDKRKHRLVTTLEKHKSAINVLLLSTDGSVLYSGACDRSIIVWEKMSKEGGCMSAVGALKGHKKAVLCLAMAGDLVFSGSADNTIRIWRKIDNSIIGNGYEKKYSCLVILEGHKGPVKCLEAAVDSDETSVDCSITSFKVYSGSLDCDIKFWNFSYTSL